MRKIKEIQYIGSESGNPGCTNGNYDEEYSVVFEDGTKENVYSCRCGNGCGGSFPINRLTIGQEYTEEEWEGLLFGEC